MKATLLTLSIISLIIWGGIRRYKSQISFQDCLGHIKRAADANSITLATQELQTAVTYLKDNNLTKGYTSLFWNTPDEDVSFWFTNLNTALSNLQATKDSASSLEKSNLLLKLRETLLDNTKDGEKVTRPSGIEIYPNNMAYFIWAGISLLVAIVTGIGLGLLDE